MEQTLVIFKPDSVQRGVVGEILTRFEKAGLKIVAMRMLRPNTDHFHKHYEDIGKMISRRGQKAFDITLDYVQDGPIIAMVLQGIEAIELVRKMTGPTEPKSALPGTIRGDYAHMSFLHADKEGVSVANLLHASGSKEDAKLEIPHWFSKEEIYNYSTVHERFTQSRKTKI